MKHKTSKLLSILLALALAMLVTVSPLGAASADTVPADVTKTVAYMFVGADAKLVNAVDPDDLDAFAEILGIDLNERVPQKVDLTDDGTPDLEVTVREEPASATSAGPVSPRKVIDLQRMPGAECGPFTVTKSGIPWEFRFVFVDLVDRLEFTVRGFIGATAGGITSVEMTVPQVGPMVHTLPITGKLSGWYKIAGNDTASGRIQFEEVPAGHKFEADVEYYFRSDEVLTRLEGLNLKPFDCIYTISPWVQEADEKPLDGEYFGPVWFYSMTPGEREFDPNDPEAADVVFTSSAPFNEFLNWVEIGGERLPENAYDVEEGSTKVTIKADYLRTLAIGEEQELPVIIGSKRSDAFGLLRMKALAPATPTVTYDAKDGTGNTIQSVTWQKGSGKNLDLTFKRSEDDHLTYRLFDSLEIDGVTVGSANYSADDGSLKLSIKPEYLETLSVGDHTVKVNFQDGSATVKLTVKAATENPKTGDESIELVR